MAQMLGQDPNTWRPSQATGLHPEVELEAWAYQRAHLMAGQKRIYDEENLSSVTELRRKMVQAYKARHEANVTGDPAESMPLEWDPNELADARFKIARIHNRIRKEVDPNFNAYTDPFLGALSQSMTEGNLATSGAQPMRGGIGGVVGEAIGDLTLAPVRGIIDAGFEFGYGLASLGNRVIQGLSGGQLGVHVQEPTHGVVDEDGQLWTNAGKVSGFGHMAAMAQAMVYGQVTDDVAQLGNTIALKDAQRHGLERFAHSVAYGIGAFSGMGIGAGPLVALSRKGLTWLGSMGNGIHALRAGKILDLASAGTGMSAYEAIAKGESEGYGKAGLHGMALGLLGAGLGLMGRKTEAFLTQQKVPALFARTLSGAAEGVGFSVPTQEMWDLIRDPSKETWSRFAGTMAVNMAAMGMLKAFGTTPSEHLLAPEQAPRTKLPAAPEAQAKAASELQQAESIARSAAVEPKKPLVSEEELSILGREVPPPRTEAPSLKEDILEREKGQLERRVEELSTDPMTGLQTPSVYEKAKARIDADPNYEWVTVDLRNVKAANTLIGREAADELIRNAAKQLRVGAYELGISPRHLFRAGGDEFAVAIRSGSELGRELVRRVSKRIYEERIGDSEYSFGARFGIGKTVDAAHEVTEAMKGFESGPKFREISKRLASSEEAMRSPELRKPAFEAKQRARQEIAAETRGPKSERRVQEEREELNQEITNRSFPAARGTAPVEGAEPIRASDIMKRLQGVRPEDPIKFPIRTGRAGRNARGWFGTQENLVRQADALDLNNGAHEFAHAMQNQTIGQKWKPGKGELRDELLKIGKPLYNENWPLWMRIREGWAEFWSRDLLGDPELETQFPNAHRWLKAWIAAPEQAAVLNQYKHIKEGFQEYRDQGSKSRVRMTRHMYGDPLSPEQKAVRGSVWSRVKKRLDVATDDIATYKHPMQQYGIEKGDVPIIADPYRVASIQRGRAQEIAKTFIWRATISQSGERTGEPLQAAFSGIKDAELNDLLDYIQSRISLEMIEKGKIVQLPKEDYLAVIADTAARGLTEKYETAGRRIKGVFDRLIDYSEQHGAVSEVGGQLIKDSYSLYIPFFRILEGAPERGGSPPRGAAERGTGLYRRKGSTRELKDPMQGMVELITSVISKSHQASIMKSARMLSHIEPGLGGLMTKVPRDVRPIKLDVNGLHKMLDKMGYNVTAKDGISEEDLASIITLFEPVKRPTGHEAIVEYSPNYTEADIEFIHRRGGEAAAKEAEKERGKAGWYEMDPEWFETMMGIDAGHTNSLIRGASFLTRMQKLGAAGLAPGYHMFNMFKDSVTAQIFGSSKLATRYVPIVGGIVETAVGGWAQVRGRGPISHLLKKIGKEPSKVDPIAQRLMDAGGKGSTYLGEALQRKGLSYEGITKKDFDEKLKGTLMHPARATLHLLEKMESAMSETSLFNRTREYKLAYERAKAAGKDEVEAHYEGLEAASEITQNFIRNGVTVRGLSRIIPFFGARVGGARRLTRALLGYDGTRTQLQAWLGGAGTATTLGILSYLFHGDEDWWNQRASWLKNNFWSFKVGGLEITLPKNEDIGKLMSNPAEYALGVVFGTNKESAWDMLGEMFIDEIRGYAVLPTFFGPSLEALTNYSMFTGKEIVPSWMSEALPPEKRHFIYTTWIARQIGAVFGVSPLKVEHLLRQHTGGLGLSVSRALDEVFNLGPEIRRDHYVPASQEELAEMPFIGRFFANHPFEQGRDVSKLYSLYTELNQQKDPKMNELRLALGRAKRQLSEVWKASREGRISREQADERAYKIAHPLIERYERTKR